MFSKVSLSNVSLVCTAVTVINVKLAVQKTVALGIIFQHGFLCADTHALVVRAVISGVVILVESRKPHRISRKA